MSQIERKVTIVAVRSGARAEHGLTPQLNAAVRRGFNKKVKFVLEPTTYQNLPRAPGRSAKQVASNA